MKKTSTNGGFPGGTLLGKLLAVLLAAHLFLPVTAQNRKPVSVNVQNATIEHVISTLKTQYGFSFVIPSDEIDLTRRVTLNLQQRPIDEVLGILFADQPVHIEFLGRNVIRISRKIEPPASTLVSGVGLGFVAQHYGWNWAYVGILGMALVGMGVFLLMWGARADGYSTEADAEH